MPNIKQEDVLKWLMLHLRSSAKHIKCVNPNSAFDNRGPDMIVEYNDDIVCHVECIAFTYTNRGKNQSDFWKAFAQAISS